MKMKEKYIKEIFDLGKRIRGHKNGEGLSVDKLNELEIKSLQVIINLRKGVLKKVEAESEK